jgi:hypothetical protein
MTALIFIGIVSVLAIGTAIGYVYGGRDKNDELVGMLTDSVIRNVSLEKDVDSLADFVAQQVDEAKELNVLIDDLRNDCRGYQARLLRLLAEKNITRLELDILEREVSDLLEEDIMRKLHNTVQDEVSRKWNAMTGENTTPHIITSNSNNDA